MNPHSLPDCKPRHIRNGGKSGEICTNCLAEVGSGKRHYAAIASKRKAYKNAMPAYLQQEIDNYYFVLNTEQ